MTAVIIQTDAHILLRKMNQTDVPPTKKKTQPKKLQLYASWELMRWNVRHLKTQYRKANNWLTLTGVGHQSQILIECNSEKLRLDVLSKPSISSTYQNATATAFNLRDTLAVYFLNQGEVSFR